MRAQIIGTGSCLPEKIVTNDYLSTIVETSDEWDQQPHRDPSEAYFD